MGTVIVMGVPPYFIINVFLCMSKYLYFLPHHIPLSCNVSYTAFILHMQYFRGYQEKSKRHPRTLLPLLERGPVHSGEPHTLGDITALLAVFKRWTRCQADGVGAGGSGLMMVNFLCQLAGPACPDPWSNVIPDVSVKEFF